MKKLEPDLKRLLKTEKILVDIIFFGSALKSKEKPDDLDVCIFLREKDYKKSEEIGDLFVDTISKVRQEKTKKGLSLKYRVKRLVIDKKLKDMIDDLRAVTNAEVIEFGEFMVEI